MFVLGAVMGSFLCCQARRLHRRAAGGRPLGRWSVCEHCGRRLKWYDNIPLLSWLMLRGRCRHCHARIGAGEFLAELGGGAMGLLLAAVMPLTGYAVLDAGRGALTLAGIAQGGTILAPWAWGIWAAQVVLGLVLLFLAIYDGLYGELPTRGLTFSLICATLVVILRQWSSFAVSAEASFWGDLEGWAPALDSLASALVLGGIYLLLYLISRGKWVGDGDWPLALAIGLSLGSPWLALCALFVANFSASLVMGPAALRAKTSSGSAYQIHFGPFLVLAWAAVLALAAPLTASLAL